MSMRHSVLASYLDKITYFLLKGLPTRSPFVRTDCTIKHGGEIFVVGAVKGVEQMSLYKTDREESVVEI